MSVLARCANPENLYKAVQVNMLTTIYQFVTIN